MQGRDMHCVVLREAPPAARKFPKQHGCCYVMMQGAHFLTFPFQPKSSAGSPESAPPRLPLVPETAMEPPSQKGKGKWNIHIL